MIRGKGEGENLWKWVPHNFDCRRRMPPGPRLAVRGSPAARSSPRRPLTPCKPLHVLPAFAFASEHELTLHDRRVYHRAKQSIPMVSVHGVLVTPWSARRPAHFGVGRSAKRTPAKASYRPRYCDLCQLLVVSTVEPNHSRRFMVVGGIKSYITHQTMILIQDC